MDLGRRNWLGDIECFGERLRRPRNEDELIRILQDAKENPSPVRPMGSRHSMTRCMQAQRDGKWGTAVDMRQFTQLRDGTGLRVHRSTDGITVTVPAGRTFIDVATELRDHDLTFNVITELGTLTVGAAACGATKDSSGTGEFGQVCHDVVGMTLIQPNGEPVELTREKDGEQFEALCCSYGLFGIVTEVTFRVVPHSYVSLCHEEIPLERFDERTKELLDDGNALFLYLFPFGKRPRIIAEVRRTVDADRSRGYWRLWLRNFFWRIGLHFFVRIPLVGRLVPAGVRWFLLWIMRPAAVSPVDQIVDFRHDSPKFAKFTFSMWAFPRKSFASILEEYFALCRAERDKGGFHTFLPQVSYHIGQDESSLLSYSHDSDVWSLDPISSGRDPGWDAYGGDFAFLDRFNEQCISRGGKPLFNQTPRLTRTLVERAFGDRLGRFETIRRQFDPKGRMLNDYFAGLLPLEGLQKLDQRPFVDAAQGRTETVTAIYNEVGALAKVQQPVDERGRPGPRVPPPR
jgi:FAD/FMN-containing dehydrogenase